MSISGNPSRFAELAIGNDGFWPDLSVADFQKAYRLPGEYLGEMLAADVRMAMGEVNDDLAECKDRCQAAGAATLADVPAKFLRKCTDPAATYARAVYCRAKASLLSQFATVTRRESAENTGKELPERAETFLAFSQQAVRSLQGRGRITAALL